MPSCFELLTGLEGQLKVSQVLFQAGQHARRPLRRRILRRESAKDGGAHRAGRVVRFRCGLTRDRPQHLTPPFEPPPQQRALHGGNAGRHPDFVVSLLE
eukprot:4219783-Pyramimonas_sp.AAC.1